VLARPYLTGRERLLRQRMIQLISSGKEFTVQGFLKGAQSLLDLKSQAGGADFREHGRVRLDRFCRKQSRESKAARSGSTSQNTAMRIYCPWSLALWLTSLSVISVSELSRL
jgi:hypothetical protein